eukprot:6481897-Amphidinium_carterae.1
MDMLDGQLVAFLDHMHQQGDRASQARDVVYGTAFMMSVNGIKQVLPRSYRALQGFARVDPPVARDPTPIEAAALLVHHLVTSADLIAMLSGLASVIGFDLFARPSEVLGITAEEVVAPRHFGYGDVGVVIASSKPMGGGVPTAAKNGEFDETIIAGLPGMQLEFVRGLLQRMAALFPQGVPLLHPLTLGQFERAVRSASQSLSLEGLRISPHTARHGG